MFLHAVFKIVRNAGIECTVGAAEDINIPVHLLINHIFQVGSEEYHDEAMGRMIVYNQQIVVDEISLFPIFPVVEAEVEWE